jgi:phosphoglycolate phosphatase
LRFKGIIFDLDGTLLDSLRDIADSMNKVLSANGYPTCQVEDYQKYVGEGMQQLVRNALAGAEYEEEDVLRLEKQMQEQYAAHWNVHTRPYAGITAALRMLKYRGEIQIGVLSNKPDHFTKEIIDNYFPDTFSVVLGAREGIPKKPDPTAAIEIAKTWGIDPKDIMFIGDSRIDIETGRNAGMYTIGVLWGFRDAAELLGAGANFLLGKPSELAAFLGNADRETYKPI